MLIFEIWLTIFTEKKVVSSSKFFKSLVFILQNFIILAQNLHFFWYPTMTVADWNSYSKFWESLSMLSLDYLAVKYELIQQFLYTEIAIILLALASIIIVGFFKSQGKKVHPFYLSIVKVTIIFLCDLCFIPTIILFLLVIKYSNQGPNYIEEYPNNLNKNDLDYGTGGIIFSVFCIFALLLLTIFFEASSYEIWQSQDQNVCDKRVQPNVNMLTKCVYFINCCLFVIIQQNHYQTLLIISITLNFLIALFFIYYIPYYCFLLNFLKAFIHGSLVFVGFFFFLALKINNSTVVFVLAFLIQIPWGIILYDGLRYRISLIKYSEDCFSEKIEFFEISIRNLLVSGEKGEELIKIMNKNLNFSYSKRNCILQAYYCIDVLNNPSLGLNKIATVNHWGFDILENFQVYKCKQYTLNICKHVSEVLKLYNFFVDFHEVKNLDIKFCKQYSKFLSQILHKSPPLLKMKLFVKSLIHKMDLIRFFYESLIQRFPCSLEVKDYYGSFVLNILGDAESGQNYLNKSTERETCIAKIGTKNTFNFVSNRCFFVISGNSKINYKKKKDKTSRPKPKDYFGKIIYFSKSFLSLLSFNEQTIKGIYLDHLLPVYLRKLHKGYMQKFIKNHVSQTVFDCYPLCLLDSNGYLVECCISSECIGAEGSLHFVCAIDPVGNCRRDFAIVDINGLILAHSKGFSALVRYENNHAEGHVINEFFDIFIEGFCDDKVISIIPKNEMNLAKNPIFVMKKIVTIGKSSLIFFYISEEKENLLMRQTVRKKTTETEKMKKKIKEKKIRSLIEEEKQEKDEKKVEIYSIKSNFIDSDRDADTNLRSKHSSHSTSISFLSTKETQSLKKSIRALNIAKLVLISSIIVMIGSNIAITAYISKEVNHSNSLTAFTNLSNLAYALSQTALILRAIDLNYRTELFQVFTLQNATDNIELLKKYKNLLLTDYDSWSYCPSSNIINENVISYWDYYGSEPIIKYGSLTSIVGLIITKAQEIISQIKNGEQNYDKNFFFIIFNCLGSSFEQANNAIKGLEDCEYNRVEELTITKNYLLIAGVGITGIALLFIIVYLLSIDKHLNSLWQYLRKRVKNGHCEVKNMISDRLCNYHSVFDVHNKEDDEVKEWTEISYKHSLHYLMRFSLIFVLGAVLYIVSAVVFFEHIHVNLINRPKLISILIQRRIQLTELCIYSLETELATREDSLIDMFPNFDSFIPTSLTITNIVDNIILTRKILIKDEIKSLMSTDLYSYIFEYLPDTPHFLVFGTFRGLAFLIQESYFISFNNAKDTQETLENFFEQVIEFNKITEMTSSLANDNSKKIIEEQLNNLIYFISASCLILIAVYFAYFYPYLCSEIHVVKNITKILLILPSISEEFATGNRKPKLNGS
ncbi:hypothetical protein SteCoe_862 [Stentor coeruleus]|uniref:PAS domain-containing protein n=1 Tax=Stentor coeruleus TaxID=5963 RepID=A0A1R2D321_9CILI|nr:hypothetical protein SteCoe_862 [Stentor coeruleus]